MFAVCLLIFDGDFLQGLQIQCIDSHYYYVLLEDHLKFWSEISYCEAKMQISTTKQAKFVRWNFKGNSRKSICSCIKFEHSEMQQKLKLLVVSMLAILLFSTGLCSVCAI